MVLALIGGSILTTLKSVANEVELPERSLSSKVTNVQPMTGLVLWSDNEAVQTDAIQLEYSYMRYDDVVVGPAKYDWSVVDQLLSQIASRNHQAVLRFYFVYTGKNSSVPAYIKALPDYAETKGKSEGKNTTFCDWSNTTLQKATLDFYTEFAQRYDNDPRLAYLQTGFGLWAEYHIYDGPMQMGKTFPTADHQKAFATHLSKTFVNTPWSVSVDAADDEWSALGRSETIKSLPFGLLNDSFLCKQHARENARNWATFGGDRWQRQPAGGELSYYNDRDQKLALSPQGPNGIRFEELAKQFHITYMIADGQTEYQTNQRLKEASMALGYRFRVTKLRSADGASEVTIRNEGIAPLYHDAFAAVNGVRAKDSLKGLLPDEEKMYRIRGGAVAPTLTIESDRLVPGQTIEFNADL